MFRFWFMSNVSDIFLHNNAVHDAAYYCEVHGYEGKQVYPWMDGKKMVGLAVDCSETEVMPNGGTRTWVDYAYIEFTPELRREYMNTLNAAIAAELFKVKG